MESDGVSDAKLAELIRVTEEATSAFMCGDMARYLALTPHAPGFVLMNPFGGEPARYENRNDSLMKVADYFKAGEVKLEVVEDLCVW